MSPQPENDRRTKVEALKRDQKAAERRKRMPVIVGAVLVGAALIAVPTVKALSGGDSTEPAVAAQKPLSSAAAQCGQVLVDPATGNNDHITGTVEYPTAPPSSGKHYAVPAAVNERGFYTEKDVPRVEELVHNLEHGYTVVWYLPTLDPAALAELKMRAEELRDAPETRKFIAAPWAETRGKFPEGKSIAISHWGKTQGYRQYCGGFSGDAVRAFLDAHPTSDSPEPAMA